MFYKETTNNNISQYTPSRTGYIFSGWMNSINDNDGVYVYDKNGIFVNNTGYWTNDIWTALSGAMLYAQWSPRTYLVTFDANGGICAEQTKSVTFEATYGTLPTPTRTGYVFSGWYTAKTGGTLVTSSTTVSTASDHTLYAQWTPSPYTVSLDQQGGWNGTISVIADYEQPMPTPITLPEKQFTVTFDGTGGTPEVPSLQAVCTFLGYFASRGGVGTQYYTSTGASAHIWDVPQNSTIYANWQTSEIVLPNASRDGYSFSGWFSDRVNTDFIGNAGEYYQVNDNTTLYASWTANTYNVFFDANTGYCYLEKKEVLYDDRYGELPLATVRKDGTFFDVDGEWVRPQDSILYAHWSANTYIVGGMDLDDTLTSRDEINAKMVIVLDEATDQWGIKVTRVEIKNIMPPRDIQEAMDKQMKAEREKRQTLLEAQAHREASVTRAEGDKQAAILKAEAERDAAIARATGEAESIRLVYEAEANGLKLLAEAGVNETVLALKKVEALKELGHGQATKIVVPTEIASLAADMTIKGELLDIADKANITPEIPIVQNQDDCCDDDNRTTTTKDLKEQQKQNFKSMSKEERTELLDKVLHRK
ncbi:MAG: hypothetical protein E7260_09605 [Lachnospiraceae bacterium]|nr:hypothetical protein [Lachnospiraceae bacterium]